MGIVCVNVQSHFATGACKPPELSTVTSNRNSLTSGEHVLIRLPA